jgi:hypothetical protein
MDKFLRAGWEHRIIKEIAQDELTWLSADLRDCQKLCRYLRACGDSNCRCAECQKHRRGIKRLRKFKTDISADSVIISELKKVVVMISDVTKVEPGSVVVSIWVSLMVYVKVSGGLDVV